MEVIPQSQQDALRWYEKLAMSLSSAEVLLRQLLSKHEGSGDWLEYILQDRVLRSIDGGWQLASYLKTKEGSSLVDQQTAYINAVLSKLFKRKDFRTFKLNVSEKSGKLVVKTEMKIRQWPFVVRVVRSDSDGNPLSFVDVEIDILSEGVNIFESIAWRQIMEGKDTNEQLQVYIGQEQLLSDWMTEGERKDKRDKLKSPDIVIARTDSTHSIVEYIRDPRPVIMVSFSLDGTVKFDLPTHLQLNAMPLIEVIKEAQQELKFEFADLPHNLTAKVHPLAIDSIDHKKESAQIMNELDEQSFVYPELQKLAELCNLRTAEVSLVLDDELIKMARDLIERYKGNNIKISRHIVFSLAVSLLTHRSVGFPVASSEDDQELMLSTLGLQAMEAVKLMNKTLEQGELEVNRFLQMTNLLEDLKKELKDGDYTLTKIIDLLKEKYSQSSLLADLLKLLTYEQDILNGNNNDIGHNEFYDMVEPYTASYLFKKLAEIENLLNEDKKKTLLSKIKNYYQVSYKLQQFINNDLDFLLDEKDQQKYLTQFRSLISEKLWDKFSQGFSVVWGGLTIDTTIVRQAFAPDIEKRTQQLQKVFDELKNEIKEKYKSNGADILVTQLAGIYAKKDEGRVLETTKKITNSLRKAKLALRSILELRTRDPISLANQAQLSRVTAEFLPFMGKLLALLQPQVNTSSVGGVVGRHIFQTSASVSTPEVWGFINEVAHIKSKIDDPVLMFKLSLTYLRMNGIAKKEFKGFIESLDLKEKDANLLVQMLESDSYAVLGADELDKSKHGFMSFELETAQDLYERKKLIERSLWFLDVFNQYLEDSSTSSAKFFREWGLEQSWKAHLEYEAKAYPVNLADTLLFLTIASKQFDDDDRIYRELLNDIRSKRANLVIELISQLAEYKKAFKFQESITIPRPKQAIDREAITVPKVEQVQISAFSTLIVTLFDKVELKKYVADRFGLSEQEVDRLYQVVSKMKLSVKERKYLLSSVMEARHIKQVDIVKHNIENLLTSWILDNELRNKVRERINGEEFQEKLGLLTLIYDLDRKIFERTLKDDAAQKLFDQYQKKEKDTPVVKISGEDKRKFGQHVLRRTGLEEGPTKEFLLRVKDLFETLWLKERWSVILEDRQIIEKINEWYKSLETTADFENSRILFSDLFEFIQKKLNQLYDQEADEYFSTSIINLMEQTKFDFNKIDKVIGGLDDSLREWQGLMIEYIVNRQVNIDEVIKLLQDDSDHRVARKLVGQMRELLKEAGFNVNMFDLELAEFIRDHLFEKPQLADEFARLMELRT